MEISLSFNYALPLVRSPPKPTVSSSQVTTHSVTTQEKETVDSHSDARGGAYLKINRSHCRSGEAVINVLGKAVVRYERENILWQSRGLYSPAVTGKS